MIAKQRVDFLKELIVSQNKVAMANMDPSAVRSYKTNRMKKMFQRSTANDLDIEKQKIAIDLYDETEVINSEVRAFINFKVEDIEKQH